NRGSICAKEYLSYERIPVAIILARQTITIIDREPATLPTPPTLSMVTKIRVKRAVQMTGKSVKTCRYIPKPLSANALLKSNDNHRPKPTTVPSKGPNVLSV